MPVFVHFTTSAMLPLLPKSEFKICSLQTLLYDYGFAPMSGEISGGGIAGIHDEVTTAFVDSSKSNGYWGGCKKLMQSYASKKWTSKFASVNDLNKYLSEYCDKFSLNRFLVIAVSLLREYQMGRFLPSESELILTELTQKLDEYSEKHLKQLLAHYVVMRYFSLSKKHDLDRGGQFITNLYQNIPINFLELSDPEKLKIITDLTQTSEDFIIEDIASQPCEDYGDLQRALRDPKNTADLWFILRVGKPQKQYPNLDLTKRDIELFANAIDRTKSLMMRLRNRDCQVLTSAEQLYVTSPFPLAIFVNSDDKEAFTQLKNEWRSTKPLRLGIDIRCMATSGNNVDQLRAFLTAHQIDSVEIKSFEEMGLSDQTVTSCNVVSASQPALFATTPAASKVTEQDLGFARR